MSYHDINSKFTKLQLKQIFGKVVSIPQWVAVMLDEGWWWERDGHNHISIWLECLGIDGRQEGIVST